MNKVIGAVCYQNFQLFKNDYIFENPYWNSLYMRYHIVNENYQYELKTVPLEVVNSARPFCSSLNTPVPIEDLLQFTEITIYESIEKIILIKIEKCILWNKKV